MESKTTEGVSSYRFDNGSSLGLHSYGENFGLCLYIVTICAGLCNPEKKLLELHQKEICTKSPTIESDD